jgi:outer membrane protein
MKLLPLAIIMSLLLNNFSFAQAQLESKIPTPGRKPTPPTKSVDSSSKPKFYNGANIKLPSLPAQDNQIQENKNSMDSNDYSTNKSLKKRLSISDVYIAAYPVDSRIGAARNDLEATSHHADAEFARTWGPQLALTAGFMWRDSIGSPTPATQNFSQGSGTTGSVGITLNQPIFNYQQILQAQQSEYAVTVNGIRNAIAQQDLIVRVVKSYLDVLRLEYSIQLKNEEYNAAKQHLRYLQEQLKVDPSMIVPVREARGRIETIEGVIKSLETSLAVAKGVFRQTWRIDLNANQLKQLKRKVTFTPPHPSNPNEWVEQARASNLMVQYNQGLVELAKYPIENAKAALYRPIINGTFSYAHSHMAGSGYDISTDGFTGGVNVTIPIFDGGYTRAKTREMISIQNRILDDLETAQITAAQFALEAIMNINNGLDAIRSYQKSADDADFVLRGKKELFQNGSGSSSFEVLAQVQIRNQAMQQLIDEKFKVLLNKATLLQATGILSLSDLEELDRLLE